ncbi:LOW QUALITY PROTEIN: A-kinase anchor protein 9 [Anguilla anguilla]|uniref:LOW QUALITY PROTEIN: A-kinase anchor protein 9 n=1 Tax=Anguilla anguilla TaxID=7936 RepID=UPI0015AE8B02|nr:LOW QUALITY PROTEIN: A-kinase anchor protein 9 [Anguilla anguilla]
MEDQERQKKLEAGKAKLAEYRQRKADGQKKSKKKRRTAEAQGTGTGTRDEEERDQPSGQERTRSGADSPATEFTISRKLRSGETVKHDQTFTIEPESEVSTTAEDCTSEEEDLGVPGPGSNGDEAAGWRARLRTMEDELAARQRATEEVTKELEELRAAFGAELQNFEAAINQRDGIITQLTTNLQQARKEKDDIMREFQEMTDRSQKLQIQFQQLQAGENLRNSSHSSTAADLLQARVQITSIQQQVEQRETQVKVCSEKMEELQLQIGQLQDRLGQSETLGRTQEEHFLQTLNEKDTLIAEQKRIIADRESLLTTVKNDLEESQKSLNDLRVQAAERSRELESCQGELSSSKQRERMSSSEIRQLMATVEDLQKRSHKDGRSESDVAQKFEADAERKMDQLRAELDEMYGQQIVQMKQEMQTQHSTEVRRLRERDRLELEALRAQCSANAEQMDALSLRIAELQRDAEAAEALQEKARRELSCASEEKLKLLGRIEDLRHELRSVRKAERVSQTGTGQEGKNGEVQRLQATIGHLEAQLAAVQEANRDLESKHESEVTNYKIKLEMLEREKDAVLGRMAESQEAELERLRTQMLFSHEEELAKLREDLRKEGALHLENLRDEMALKQERAVRDLQKGLQEQLRATRCEKESLAAEKVALLNKINVLEERLNRSSESASAKELAARLEEHQAEMEGIRQEEKDKGADLLRKTEVVMRMDEERQKAWKPQSGNISLKESSEAVKEERERTLEQNQRSRTQGKALAVENEQLYERQIEKGEIQKRHSTFSFTEKNFEADYEELKEEYACLLKVKGELEAEILRVTADYEVKLSDLQSQIRKLQECEAQPRGLQRDNGEADKMEDFTDGSKSMEENAGGLTEALQRGESGPSPRRSEPPALRGDEAEQATGDARRASAERDGRRDSPWERRARGCLRSWPAAAAPALAGIVTGGGASRQGRGRGRGRPPPPPPPPRRSSPGETASPGRSKSGRRAICLARLAGGGGPRGRPSRVRARGGGAPAGEAPRGDPGRSEADSAAAQREAQAQREERLRMLRTPQRGERSATPRQAAALGQEEFQLQFEALRISLSQICAAQLELQKEGLQVEREACLRRQEQQLREEHLRELQDLRGPHSGPGEGARPPEETASLEAHFQEQRTRLEERHSREIERLRASLQQEARHTEERHAAELVLLKQRLLDLTASPALPSFSRESQFTVPNEEESEEYKHRAELERLADEHGGGAQAVEPEASPATGHHPGGINGGVWSMEGHEAAQLIQTLERQHQERVEEEIAKVIVQMSIEFAQQTEQARIAKEARETATTTQTRRDEFGGADEPTPGVGGPGGPGGGAAQTGRGFAAERDGREGELERPAEVLSPRPNKAPPGGQGLSCEGNEGAGLVLSPKPPRVTRQHAELQNEEADKRPRGGGVSSRSLPPDISQSDVSPDVITNERNLLRRANRNLRQVLSDVLKTTAATEETIGHYMEGLLDASAGKQPAPRAGGQRASAGAFQDYSSHNAGAGGGGDALPGGCHGSQAEVGDDDASAWSGGTESDEGLSSLPTGAEPRLENEEYLMNISSRLQAAVEKLLVAITETTNQLEHAQVTQTELMRESFRHNEEMVELLRRQEELQESLNEEAQARQRLALELHRAEGVIDGYSGERAVLERKLGEKQELLLHLEQQLQVTGSRLQELEQERRQVHREKELLARQQSAMRDGTGSRELRLVEAAVVAAPEADLLEETEKLMKEKVEVQLQAEKDSGDLLKRLKCLEAEVEERASREVELEEAHRVERSDLRQQIQALEKQVEKNRRFLDEQAVDREHERDVFQQEITKLEQQLKNAQKQQPSTDQYNKEVDRLTAQLQEKSDRCSELLLRSEQLQREVQDGGEEVERLETRVRELEQALLVGTETPQVEQKSPNPPEKGTLDTTLEVELQTEREALDRKEKEISNLEEQLEQFREELENKSEEAQQLHMQLEIQKKELSSQQEDLQHRGDLLKVLEDKSELVRELESQVECMRAEQERLKKNREVETDQLNAVIEKLQQELSTIERQTPDEGPRDADRASARAREEVRLAGGDDGGDEPKKREAERAARELAALRASHGSLLEQYERLREETSGDNRLPELEEALRAKTAACLVMQAQVQALEESAGCRVGSLGARIAELEACVGERDAELERCGLRVQQSQAEAAALRRRVSELEDKLREKVAAALVSRAELGAVREHAKARGAGGPRGEASEEREERARGGRRRDGGAPPAPGAQTGENPLPAKVALWTEKLRELEEGLRGMQEDQELQKHLLSSSGEEVAEYEERLAVLMDLLSRITARPGSQRPPPPISTSETAIGEDPAAASDLLQEVTQEAAATKEELNSYRERSDKLQEELQEREMTIAQLKEELHTASMRAPSGEEDPAVLSKLLQEVKREAAATKEELNSNRERSDKLQEELQEREVTIVQLKEELHTASMRGPSGEEDPAVLSKLLQEVQREAAATKEELNSNRERSDKLQEELQEREMTIAQLKEELHTASMRGPSAEEDPAALSKLLQEVQREAAATKEELNSHRERSDKLQDELQVRDISIAQLQDELRQIKEAFAKSEEELKKKSGKHSASKQDRSEKARGSSAKERNDLTRKNSAPMDRAAGGSGTPKTPRAPRADAAVQTGPVRLGSAAVAGEVSDAIGEYAEKIEQMRELHAAEIMDMEARHIAESEGLRGEAGALREECRTLKAAIEDLRHSEAASPQLEHLPASQFRDGSMSDSGSDWSQHTGHDPPVLQQEFRTTPEGARRDNETDVLPDRIKSLLREVHQEGMQVLSLSELPGPEAEAEAEGGRGEAAAAQLKQQGWLRERASLLASVESLKALISTMQIHGESQARDPSGGAGEDWRAELLEAVRRAFAAERGALTSSAHSRLERLDTSDAVVCLNQLERELAEQEALQREAMGILQSADRTSLLMEVRQLKAQLQHLQQDPRVTGVADQRPVLEKLAGDHDALHPERMLLDELKAELAQTRLELESTLKAQHKHLTALDTLRTEVTEKAAEVDHLNKKLINEQRKSRELQWAFEKEKCKSEKKDQNEREDLEDVRLLLKEQQTKVAQLTEAVEKERRTSDQLKQQADRGHAQQQSLLSREQSRVSELQVQLESAQARAQELGSALERERELRGQPKQQQQQPGSPQHAVQAEEVQGEAAEEAVVESLRSQLDDKHAQVVRLLGEAEGLRLEAIQARLERDEEGRLARLAQEALREAQEQLRQLRAQAQELRAQADGTEQQALRLRRERDELQDLVSRLQGFAETRQPDTQADLCRAEDESGSRTQDWVSLEKVPEADSSFISLHEITAATANPKLMDKIINQLQHIAAKINAMTSNTTGRVTLEEADGEGLRNSVRGVVSLLQQVQALSPAQQSTAPPAGGSSNSLTERLLRQNAELTGFVSRLTEEKNDLRNSLVRLEKELRLGRPWGPPPANARHGGAGRADGVESLLASAREGWESERTQLEKRLRLAEAEATRLRGKIRSDALWDFADSDADGAALKRIYVKYLRAESFRKALVYQKKYLLLLLGSFQDCEAATLSLIARMGGRSSQSLDAANQRPRGFTRFRSAARVVIALFRMRYLVKRWYKTTEAGSISSTVHRNGQGQITANEGRRESPYLRPGSVDGYGELRGSSRGQTGRDSARFNTVPTETGSLVCSHLQNYDPDRALSDYISRLEALQRRLGSVQSGSCSYAQLHFGIRR